MKQIPPTTWKYPTRRPTFAERYGSHILAGLILLLALAVMGSEQIFGMTADKCALVFAQTTEPYEVIPVVIETDTLYWARVLCRHGINRMAECLKSNDWPGVGENLTTYALPPSMTERLSDLQASGEMPNL